MRNYGLINKILSLPHLSEDEKIPDEIDIPIYLSTKNENPYKAEFFFLLMVFYQII